VYLIRALTLQDQGILKMHQLVVRRLFLWQKTFNRMKFHCQRYQIKRKTALQRQPAGNLDLPLLSGGST
jgi:hypothetical protein